MEREVREVLEAAWNELHDHQKAPWQKLAVGDGMERFRRFLDAEAYTDAALMLVPEDFDWIVGRTNGGLTTHAQVGTNDPDKMEFADHPALAIAQASLKTKDAEHAPE